MMKISYDKLKKTAVIIAGLPILFFFFRWLNLLSAVLFSVLLCTAGYFCFRNCKSDDGERTELKISKKSLILLAVIAVIWCILGGQGGIMNQTSDHVIRNKILTDLTLKSSPLIYQDDKNNYQMLSYYIAYWMFPCTAGRLVFLLSGNTVASLAVSNFILLLQSSACVFCTFLLTALLTSHNGKARPVLSALLFIGFSGLDIIGTLLVDYSASSLQSDHMEWWAELFQFSSNTTCLFWVYNQTLPIWSLTLCLINEKHMKDFAFLALLAFPHAPFPFVGIFIFCITKAVLLILQAVKNKTLKEELHLMLSPQNFISVFAIVPIFVSYFTANGIVTGEAGEGETETVNTKFRLHDWFKLIMKEQDSSLKLLLSLQFLRDYMLFIFLEAGVYVLFLYRKGRDNRLLTCNFIALMLIPLFMIGYSADFSMRVSISALVYLCVMTIRRIIEELPEKGEIHSLDEFARKKTALFVLLCVYAAGVSTPFMEISRQTALTCEWIFARDTTHNEMIRFDYANPQTMGDGQNGANFFALGYQDSVFYRCFCKKNQ